MAPGDTDEPGDACPACAAVTDPGWVHCATCGWLLGGGTTELRRTVTVVVCDLQGSTALAERVDPETVRMVLDSYFEALGAVVAAFGGRVEKRIGDMMVSVFGLTSPQPDHPVRALHAVSECAVALESLNAQLEARWGLQLANRSGVATGEVVYTAVGGSHRQLVGAPMDEAAALEPSASPGGALVARSTVEVCGADVEFGDPVAVTGPLPDLVGAPLLSVGATLARTSVDALPGSCGGCGAEVDVAHDWCWSCGGPVQAGTDAAGRRRHVTVVFVDLTMQPTGAVDEDRLRSAEREVFDAVRSALEHHGGIVEKSIGDTVMAVFGLDRRQEDDPVRAARAALEIQTGLRGSIGSELAAGGHTVHARIGINTGPVVASAPSSDERLVTGDAVNAAARLEQMAPPGEVVVGPLTRSLLGTMAEVDSIGTLELRGRSEPVEAYRLLAVGDVHQRAGRFDLELVGRQAELDRLGDAWIDVLAGRSTQWVDLCGDAGVGKSRLLDEFVAQRPGTLVLRGVCPSYGDGITFYPVVQMVRQVAGAASGTDRVAAAQLLAEVVPDPDVGAVLSSLLGLDDRVVPVAEVSWAVRQLVSHLAADRPIVLAVDAFHRAEPTLVELLEELCSFGGTTPALLVTMSRPGRELSAAGRVTVAPLSDDDCAALVRSAVDDALAPDQVGLVVGAAAGLPLFVEQFLATLVDEGRLQLQDDRWVLTAPLASLDVPPTVESIVATRLDSLSDAERAVAEAGSVAGRSFLAAGVADLLGERDLSVSLASLVDRDLVEPSAASSLSDHEFRNQMIRDVAYGGLLKRTRSELHRRTGDWLLRHHDGPSLVEVEDVVGFHFEQSYLLGKEVGLDDDLLAATAGRAASHLSEVGSRAMLSGDMPAAAHLYARAAAVLPPGARAAEFLVLAGDAAVETGDFSLASERYSLAEAAATSDGDEVQASRARLAAATMAFLVGELPVDEAERVASLEESVLSRNADDGGLARCWRLRAYTALTRCQWGQAESAASATLEAARRSGDVALERRVVPALAAFSVHGPTPVADALRRCVELRRAVEEDRRACALIGRATAHLMAFAGDTDNARDLCLAMRRTLVDLGWAFDAALVSIDLGPIELMGGRPEAAERVLRADYETLAEMGEQNYVATVGGLLAEAVRQLGKDEEALDLARSSMATADDEDVSVQVGCLAVMSRVHRRRGDLVRARELADDAVARAATTDDPFATGEAYLVLAEVLADQGDPAGARGAAGSARSAHDAKGNRVALAEVDAFLGSLDQPA